MTRGGSEKATNGCAGRAAVARAAGDAGRSSSAAAGEGAWLRLWTRTQPRRATAAAAVTAARAVGRARPAGGSSSSIGTAGPAAPYPSEKAAAMPRVVSGSCRGSGRSATAGAGSTAGAAASMSAGSDCGRWQCGHAGSAAYKSPPQP